MWPLQNRPTKLSQDKSIYNPLMAIWQSFFAIQPEEVYTGEAWTEGMATRGRDQSADPSPEWRAAQAAPHGKAILAESDKSREREGRALAVSKACFLRKPVRSWCASFEVHT